MASTSRPCSGESSGVFSGALRSLDHAAQQEGVLAVFGDRQRTYRLGAAAARRQRIEQISWHTVITHVPPAVCFLRSSSMSASMVSTDMADEPDEVWAINRGVVEASALAVPVSVEAAAADAVDTAGPALRG